MKKPRKPAARPFANAHPVLRGRGGHLPAREKGGDSLAWTEPMRAIVWQAAAALITLDEILLVVAVAIVLRVAP
jgi:hypothetical protein